MRDGVLKYTLRELSRVISRQHGGRGSGSNLWQGKGITSSAAAANAKGITGLAAIRNLNATGGTIYGNFDGEPVDANSILVKYTYNGDTDLNGKIDANDYFQIDSGFIAGLSGYRNGDFDYNGTIDADDYFLIDNAFANQSGILSAGAIDAASVPEPGAMVGLGMLAFLAARRVRARRPL